MATIEEKERQKRRNLEILALHLQGLSGSFIARKYGLSRQMVSKIIKKFKE
ncbi:MAG: hypothetical protein DDT40_01535 [candidate division WS2 bacterium]|nr:hypothetical protein [Candidatus Psychracetigena formicireducens]